MSGARIGALLAIALGVLGLAIGVSLGVYCRRYPSSRNGAIPRLEAIAAFFVIMGLLFAGTGAAMALGLVDTPP